MADKPASKAKPDAPPVEEHEDSDDYESGEDSEGDEDAEGEEEGSDEEEYGTAYLVADNPDAEEDDPEDEGWVPEGAEPEESSDEEDDEETAPPPADKDKKKRPRESDASEDATKKAKT
ncbi:hypothetical protein RhiJN_22786 [Ceratobasidium sp. AG-Ba]|nr:hypothetical protein RhiJN_22786 [Ceratobasidium sp. AG-Ba]